MDIPAEFSNLTKLSILNLVGNQLQYLPYTFTTLKSITAIWIAENQSRPILDLQLIRGDDGEKYLTCFLFPQQGRERPYEESMFCACCGTIATCLCVDLYQHTRMLLLLLVCVSTYTSVHVCYYCYLFVCRPIPTYTYTYDDDLYQL